MNKYVVTSVKDTVFGCETKLKSKNKEFSYVLPYVFAGSINVGDKVAALSDGIMDLALIYHGKLYMVLKPVGEYQIQNFINQKFNGFDKMRFKHALRQHLRSVGIRPTLSSTNNLRLFLSQRGNIRQ